MNSEKDSAFALVEIMKKKAPEYLDLMTAQSDAEFESAFDTILERAVSGIESNSKNFESLDEEGLSGVLALAISVPGLTVTQETNSNGHVDLTVVADHCFPMRKKLGEAKVYDGPEKHIKGVEQLLGRYTTGREGRGLLIVYFKKKDIADLVKKLRDRMDTDFPLSQQGKTLDHAIKWSFLSKHSHTCGEVLDVGHIGCNLYNGVDASKSAGTN